MNVAVNENREKPREFTQVSGLPERVPPSEARQLWKMWIRDAYAESLSQDDFRKINAKIDEVIDQLRGNDGRVDRTKLLQHLGKMNSALENRLNPNAISKKVIDKLGETKF